MATGLPDRLDSMQLAEEAKVLEREYALADLPRLKDVLAEPVGVVHARYAFGKSPAGRASAQVSVQATPRLICQRCLQGFEFPVSAETEVEFAQSESDAVEDLAREPFVAEGGMVSLRELAEEELLLALPIAAACAIPETCGRAPLIGGADDEDEAAELRRPFADLRNLLKRT